MVTMRRMGLMPSGISGAGAAFGSGAARTSSSVAPIITNAIELP